MKLTMKTFSIKDVVLADATKLQDGTLYVNCTELRALLLKDGMVTDITFDVARPTESTRIIHILDAVEPRWKPDSPAPCFPGFMGESITVGRGVTHRLEGMAVVTTGTNIILPTGSETGVLEFNDAVIDMSGLGRQYSVCSDTVNLCIGVTIKSDITPAQFDEAARMAGLRAATYLARCTKDLPCDNEKVFETGCVDPKLPNVAYINQIQSQGLLCRTSLYGLPLESGFIPTVVHPNELLDGALVSSNYRNFMRFCTYIQQNNPVVRTLYDHHGKDLNFVGMVLSRGHYDDLPAKNRTGSFAAKLAGLLGAQACILTLEGSGNATVDFMATVRGLEDAGIAAVPIAHEFGGPAGEDFPLFDVPRQAVSIVSGGGIDRRFTMPQVDKVIGGDSIRFVYADKAFSTDDPHLSRTATPYFYFGSYIAMPTNGFRCFEF